MKPNPSTEVVRPIAPLIIRGEIIADHLVEVDGRGGGLTFLAPDAFGYIDRIALATPSALCDLYELSFDDILDYLAALGGRLNVVENKYLQCARELCYQTAPTTKPIVDSAYAELGAMFKREVVREMVDAQIGIDYLEGWVTRSDHSGAQLGIRCFGARTLHIIAGNSPMISGLTIIRNAVLRSDAIIKAPSNDPFTSIAIAQTMIEMAPTHPITRHLTVGYWRGGDTRIEERLYQPHNIEKIVAWGGFASLKHVTKYIQPGLELISLDPKRSASIIGSETFLNEEVMRDVARRLASDIGAMNQSACVNARVAYVLSGTDALGIERANKFGECVYRSLLELPSRTSTKPKFYDRELKADVDALRLSEHWYRVFGGNDNEGAIIVSQLPEPVDFASRLDCRTANIVPIDSIKDVMSAVDAYTQTVGIYPESLKEDLIDILPLYGAQRFVSLGFAVQATLSKPQDGIEPLRRMGKWIVNETRTPEVGRPPWVA